MQLFYFYDEDGNACGYDKGYEDYPYLYFYNVIGGLQHFSTDKLIEGVCVSECPDDDLSSHNYGAEYEFQLPKCKGTKKNGDCKIKYKNYYISKHLFRRVCFPKSNDDIEYDPAHEYLASIYDPDSGETFKKVISHQDTVNQSGKIYIAQDAISGENDP